MRAEKLYRSRPKDAAKIFARYSSPEAEVGAAMAGWPAGTVARLQTLAVAVPAKRRGRAQPRPRALLVAARRGGGRSLAGSCGARAGLAVRRPRRGPSPPAVSDPRSARLRAVVSGARADTRPDARSPARRARGRGARGRRPREAPLRRRAPAPRPTSIRGEAVRAPPRVRRPSDPEARVAAAVGRFDKGNPSAAFGRLGPLVRVFPHAPTVRFHLGLLLLWLGQVDRARDELRQARAEDPKSPLGRAADSYLSALRSVGTR